MPEAIARAGIEPRWPAFRETFVTLVRDARIAEWLAAPSGQVAIVQGENGEVCPPALLRKNLTDVPVEIRTHPGGHHLPLQTPELCVEAVQ